METKRIASVLFNLISIDKQLISDFTTLYEVFAHYSVVIALKQAAYIGLLAELMKALPNEVTEEMKRLEQERAAKATSAVADKSLETLIREMLGDHPQGGEHPHV